MIKSAGAVRSHQTNELRNTVIPQGTFSCPSGNSPFVAPAESKPYVQQYAVCELRIFYEINATVTRLPFPIFGAVAGLWSAPDYLIRER